jgi:demethylmenaquinone methyltransferase / 2-methoxy-6-polyprenyl-1,4-benzoquinol methylase
MRESAAMKASERHGQREPRPPLSVSHVGDGHRAHFVRSLFDDTAGDYDKINQIFSLGSGAWYRRRCLLRAGLHPGLRTIDVAVGTGLIAREAVRICGDRADVIGIDVSGAMLAVARRKLGVALLQGLAEELPLADGVADFVTMGYALRHVSDLLVAFREFHRVLRHGGTVLVLEIAKPTRPLARALISTYLGRLVPLLCRWALGRRSRQLMDYYWHTIESCVPPDEIVGAMRDSGFRDVSCEAEFDLFRSYIGRKS